MKKRLYVGIVILLLILTVGFAAVSTNLIFSSYASVSFNAADYEVLFTKALASTGNYVSLSDDAQTILYNPYDLHEVNDESVIDYKITNNSSLYDINVTIKVKLLDGNDEEVSPDGIYNIEETIVPEGTIEARSSKDGQLTITLLTGTLMANYHFVIEYEVTKLGRTDIAGGEKIEPGITVTFDANGGQMIGVTDKKVMIDTYYGELPETTKLNEAFEGWYTDPQGGEKITSASVVTIPSNHTLYAHYQDPVATYNNYGYNSLQKAVNQVPIRNTRLAVDKDTVELLKDTNESVIISEGKEMIINLNNHSVSTTGLTDEYVITNYGSLVMNSGDIISSARAIHNYGSYEANDINQTSTAEGLVIENTGKVTIEGGVYHSNNNTIANFGTLTINESEHVGYSDSSVIYLATGSNSTINDGTFTSDNGKCLSVSGTATINNGSFSCTSKYTLYFTQTADVTINDGTFESTSSNQSLAAIAGEVKIKGGVYKSEKYYSLYVTDTGSLTIDGGTISPETTAKNMIYNHGNTRINAGTFTGGSSSSYPIYNSTTGTLTVAGGSYSTNASVFMNQGTMIVKDTTIIEDSTKTIFLSNGSTAVTTIEGGTYSAKSAVILTPQNNSKMIVKGGVYNSTSNIANSNGGNLIIDGGVFTATGSNYPGIVQQSSGSTVINDGEFDAQSYAVWAKGNTTINGGYIESSASNPLYVQANATANITGATLYSPENASAVAYVSGTLNISGGTYLNETTNTVTIFVSSTGTLNVEDGTDVEEYRSNFISNSGITNINGGKIITNKQMPLLVQQSTGTMNINGGEIEAYKTHCLLVKGSTVNITGGTLKNKYSNTISIDTGANVNITGGTITNDTLNDEVVLYGSDSHGNTIYSKGTLTLSGGEINNYSSAVGIYIDQDSSLTVEDDAILSSSSGALIGNYGTLEITGGTLKGESNASYLLDNAGTATISGGSIQQLSSSHAISNSSKGILYIEDGANLSVSNSSLLNNIGQTTINGGTLTSTGPILIRNQLGSKLDITGGSLSSSGDNVINGSGTINITGGSLSISGRNGPALIWGSPTMTITENASLSSTKSASYMIQNLAGIVSIDGATLSAVGSYFNNGGTLTLNNVIADQCNGNVINNTGAVDITNSNLTSIGNETPVIYSKGTNAKVYIHSGTFTGVNSTTLFVGENSIAEIEGGKFATVENGNPIINEGNITISGDTIVQTVDRAANVFVNNSTGVAVINGGTFIPSHAAVFTNDGELTLHGDITVTNIETNLVLNYNKLTIDDGTYSGGTGTFPLVSQEPTGETTINGGSFTSEYLTLQVSAGGTMYINGGNFTTTGEAILGNEGTVVIDGNPTFTQNLEGEFGLMNTENGNLTIKSGTFRGTNGSCPLYTNSTGNLNISGGTFTSDSAFVVFIANGTNTITGGTFTSGTYTLVAFTGGTSTVSGGTYNIPSGQFAFFKDGDSTVVNLSGTPATLRRTW